VFCLCNFSLTAALLLQISEDQDSKQLDESCEVFFAISDLLGDNRAITSLFFGGGKRDRTADLLHAMQALSQLSYTPLQNRNEII
jgi:hypothetical protein